MSQPLILVTAAGGRFGGLVVPELARRGARVRGLIRDGTKREAVRAQGAAEIVVADLHDRVGVERALSGVEGVFYLAPAFQPDEAQLGLSLVAAAAQAGVRRLVFSSVLHPIITALRHHTAKLPVEEALYISGMRYVILHPGMFFQNLLPLWQGIIATGRFAAPFSARVSLGHVDYRDVAEVAALALTSDGLDFGTFELCGEGSLSRAGIAAIMADVLGRNIEATELDPAAWSARAPHDEAQKQLLEAMYCYYEAHGFAGNTVTLRAILGREPRSFRGFIQELAAQGSAARPDSAGG